MSRAPSSYLYRYWYQPSRMPWPHCACKREAVCALFEVMQPRISPGAVRRIPIHSAEAAARPLMLYWWLEKPMPHLERAGAVKVPLLRGRYPPSVVKSSKVSISKGLITKMLGSLSSPANSSLTKCALSKSSAISSQAFFSTQVEHHLCTRL